MIIKDLHQIGNNLYTIRKRKGFTQAEVAEKAELSDRTYADIERGTVSMRIDTMIKICEALKITPNDIMTVDTEEIPTAEIVLSKLDNCTNESKKIILKLLDIYIDSIEK